MSFDDVAANARFAEKQGFPFPLLCDTRREIGVGYGACATATDGFAARITYLIGSDGRVRRCWPTVSPRGHAAEVLEELSSNATP